MSDPSGNQMPVCALLQPVPEVTPAQLIVDAEAVGVQVTTQLFTSAVPVITIAAVVAVIVGVPYLTVGKVANPVAVVNSARVSQSANTPALLERHSLIAVFSEAMLELLSAHLPLVT